MNFSLDKKQYDTLHAWLDDPIIHPKCRETEGKTAIGGALTYKFIPTTIGTIAQVACGVCKNHIDLTDFDNW